MSTAFTDPALSCLFLSITGSCQLACPGCLFSKNRSEASSPPRGPMEMDALSRLLDEMAELGAQKLKLGFCDEPLLHPEVATLIRKARSRGIHTSLTTNGQALDEPRAEALLEAAPTSVFFSLDAPDKAHYLRTRGSGYEKARQNLLTLTRTHDRGGGPLGGPLDGPLDRPLDGPLDGPLDRPLDGPLGGSTAAPRTRVFATMVDRSGPLTARKAPVTRFLQAWERRCDGVIINRFLNWSTEERCLMLEGSPSSPTLPLSLPPGSRRACLSPSRELYLLRDGAAFPCVPAVVDHLHQGPDDAHEPLLLGRWPEQSLDELARSPTRARLQELHRTGAWGDEPLCAHCVAWSQHYPVRRHEAHKTVEETPMWTIRRPRNQKQGGQP